MCASTDLGVLIYQAKYSAVTGEAIWLKRIGQRDILEHVVGMALDEQTGQLFLVYVVRFGFKDKGLRFKV